MRLVDRMARNRIERQLKRRAAALKAWDTRRENERQWLLGLLPPGAMKQKKPHRAVKVHTTTRRIVLED